MSASRTSHADSLSNKIRAVPKHVIVGQASLSMRNNYEK